MNVAIIPARGGSKRIPKKNIKNFLGKPIIAYSIMAAEKSGLFERIVVSTDDREIADTAIQYGAEVPFIRPETLADDHTGTLEVIRHAVDWLRDNDRLYDYACCIYATAPFIRIRDLKKGYERLKKSRKSFAFSITSFPSPIFRALKLTDTGELAMFWPENYPKRSQDLPEAYHDAGQFYWGRSEAFLQKTSLFESNAVPIILPRYLAQDIDTPGDWHQAELIYQALYPGNSSAMKTKGAETPAQNQVQKQEQNQEQDHGPSKEVILNRYGFYTLKTIPSDQELQDYYTNKYFQENATVYKKDYPEEELVYIQNKIEQKHRIIQSFLPEDTKKSLLDIGCGEGFALSFFNEKNWTVTGLDYSTAGVNRHNPLCRDFVIKGNIFTNIKTLIKKRKRFDLIWMDNVLEHVTDPLSLLKDSLALISGNGILVIEVPNDFSILQKQLKAMALIKNDFWVAPPDHISYFNKQGLINLCQGAAFKHLKTVADFPIDFNLFHPDANYNLDSSKGRGAHLQRIRLENLFHELSPEKANILYETMADMGIGRQITGFFTPS